MAGRPRKMLRKVRALKKQADELWYRIYLANPKQVASKSADEISTAWREAHSTAWSSRDWLDRLDELIRERAELTDVKDDVDEEDG
jgi:hypothetical protein